MNTVNIYAVDTQPLNARVRNYLLHGGIEDLRDIKSMKQLKEIRGIGSDAFDEITGRFLSLGLPLPPEYCMADAKTSRQKERRALELAVLVLKENLEGEMVSCADPEEVILAINQLESMKL